jgi:hypothetical protein
MCESWPTLRLMPSAPRPWRRVLRYGVALTIALGVSILFPGSPLLWAQTPEPEEPEVLIPTTGTSTTEAFQTDLFTGSARIVIPIVVPPGLPGTTPQIALRYSSSAVDDLRGTAEPRIDTTVPPDQAPWTGLGWSLDAGGVILRDITRENRIVA